MCASSADARSSPGAALKGMEWQQEGFCTADVTGTLVAVPGSRESWACGTATHILEVWVATASLQATDGPCNIFA